MRGTTRTSAIKVAVTVTGTAIQDQCGRGHPARTRRSRTRKEPIASPSVIKSCRASKLQPDTPTRSEVTNNNTGQCHRYTP